MQENNKIEKFTDLKVWQEAHRLTIMVYKATKSFPKEELFGLTNQLRRASVSITSNIAEGFGRRSTKDRVNFYTVALGSLYEVENQLLISRDIGYLESKSWNDFENQIIITSKMLNGLIKKSKSYLLSPNS